MDYRSLLKEEKPGTLRFGGARMALFDVAAGFWGLRRQLEALVGHRLADAVLQQAGANGGASFARAFTPDLTSDVSADRSAKAAEATFRDCLAAYQAAGFGQFEIESSTWPIGRVCIRGYDTFEAWMMRQHGHQTNNPSCAYTSGVLVGFVNALTGRQDIVCVKRQCQAQGADHCAFELLPAAETEAPAVTAFDPDPFLSQQLSLIDVLFDQMPMGISILDKEMRLRRFNPTLVEFVRRYSNLPPSQVALGRSFLELVPGNEDRAGHIFEQALAGKTVRREAFPMHIGDKVSYWDSVSAPLRDQAEVVGIVHVSTDVTERVLAEQRLRETLDTMLQMSQNLVSTLDLKPLLGLILGQLESIINFDGASVLVIVDDHLELLAYRGPIDQETASTLRFPLSSFNVNALVMQQRQPLIIADVQTEQTPAAAAFRQSAQEHGDTLFNYIRSWLGVPLLIKDRVLGMLSLDHSQPGYYTEFHSQLALAFASQIAVAIENTRLREQTEHIAALAERNRLARDLHDAVTQTLFSASLIADVLPRIWERSPEVGRARLEELRELTRGALAEMRGLLLELRPATLVESQLSELLQQLATAVIGRSRLPVEVVVNGTAPQPIPPDTQVALYRIAQESLNNIVKHAEASQVIMMLTFAEDEVALTIRDDGRGFTPANVNIDSLGLTIMRERAAKVQADLQIESEVGVGTAVSVRVGLAQPA